MRYLALIGALLLGSNMTDNQGYVRVHGRTNPDHLQLTLAQCQGESASVPQSFYVAGAGWVGLAGNLMARATQDQTVTSACMARNGYVVAQQAPAPAQAQAQAQAQANRRD
jgi:hypothetical protein